MARLTEDGSSVLVVRAGKLSADDQRVLRTFPDSLELALQSRRLQAEAATASQLADADQLRTALLQAVSHDLRTPLASIKASSSSLAAARDRVDARAAHGVRSTRSTRRPTA